MTLKLDFGILNNDNEYIIYFFYISINFLSLFSRNPKRGMNMSKINIPNMFPMKMFLSCDINSLESFV